MTEPREARWLTPTEDREPINRTLAWRHVNNDETHPVDQHYSAQGKWVCYACREPIRDELVDAAPPLALAEDPERPGLHVEGS